MSDPKNPPEKNSFPSPPPTEPYMAVPKPPTEKKSLQGFAHDAIPPTQKTFLRPDFHAKLSISDRPENNSEKTEKTEKTEFSETGKFPVLPFIQGARTLISSLGGGGTRKNNSESQSDQTDTTLLPLPTLNNSRLFGPYEIVVELARTPSGSSYKARHVNQDRMYFLKIFTLEESQTQKLEERLKNTRKLVHPRIMNYVDFGVIQGLFYIAEEFIEGESLKKRMEKYLSIRETLHILHQVLVVLEYAHQQGVVHGSLGPTNIFLTKDDSIHVSDFAIPLVINPALKGFPATEVGYGALYYRDPRIIQQSQEPDFSADIYSVGSLLYEILTEKKAVSGDSVESILTSAQKNAPLLLLGKDAPQGLQMILTRATHPLVSKRYSTIRRFMQDVDNFLNFRPLLADTSPFRKIFPSISKLQMLFLSLLFLVVVVALLAIPFFSMIQTLKKKLDAQEETIQQNDQQQKETLSLLAQAFQEKASWLKPSQPAVAGLLAVHSYQMAPALSSQTFLSELYFHLNPLSSPYLPAFAEKQQFLLTPEEKIVTLDSLQGLQEWSFPPEFVRKQLVPISDSFPFQTGILLSTPLFLYVAFNQEVRQYLWTPFQQTQVFVHDSPVSAMGISKTFLFTGSKNGTLSQWDRATGSLLKTFSVGKESITALAFWESRQILFVALGEQLLSLSIQQPLSIQSFFPHRKAITQLFVSEPLQLLFSSSLDHRIQALDLNTGSILHTFIGHQGGVMGFQLDSEQKILYSISSVGELFSWKLAPQIQSERPDRSVTLKEKNLSGIVLSPKNNAILLNTQNSVYFLNRQTFEETHRLFGFHYFSPLKVAPDFSNNALYYGDASGRITSWDLKTKAPQHYFEAGDQPISALMLDPNQNRLWAGAQDGFLYGWSLDKPRAHAQILFKAHAMEVIALIADDNRVYSSSFPGKLICSELSTNAPRTLWERPAATSLVLKKDRIWAGTFDGNLWYYQAQTGEILGRWELGKQPLKIGSLTTGFLYGTIGKRLILWEIEKKKIIFETEIATPIRSVSASDEFLFVGTDQYLYVFKRNPWSLSLILSPKQPLSQIQYLSEFKSLLVCFPQAGVLCWNLDFFEQAEWLEHAYWEKRSQSKISGFEVIPSK